MLAKSNFSKLLVFSLAIILISLALPINSFAISNPWDEYKEYIPEEAPIAKRHLRGAWISTTINLDWPSKAVMNIEDDNKRIQETKDELIAILNKSVEMNMNTVFFQVSPEGDAFYESDVVPWSRYLTGSFGEDPGFDPLAFAIEEAHRRNLELHAWFNPYRVSMYTDDATVESLNIDKSVFKEHPDWIRTASSRFVVDPGIPEAREWVRNRVMEVVDNYDIDGIHFDDYFYYEGYKGELGDESAFRKYNSGGFSNIEDWRRNNTYLLIKELYNEINQEKPWVKFGVSPTAIWANKKDGFTDGSDTNAGLPNYSRSYADTKKWVEEEIIDYIAPQVYFTFANPHVPYGEAVTWWSDLIKDKKVHLYIGQALYKINDDADIYFQGYDAVEEFTRQHRFNLTKPEVNGSIMFRFKNFSDANKEQVVNTLRNDLWSTKALVPLMDWKGGQAPSTPINGQVEGLSNANKLSWTDEDENTTYYAIYRTNKGNSINIDSDRSAMELIGTVRKNNGQVQEFIDKETNNLDEVVYAVTALDRLHHESEELIIGNNQSNYFYDVNKNQAWAIDAIDKLYERDVINGVGAGKFAPGNNIRRADFLIMVMNSYGIEPDPHISDNFSDAGNTYYTEYLGTAKRLGLVLGTGNNLYLPEAEITREDMFVILHRVLSNIDQLPSNEGSNRKVFDDFIDVDEIYGYASQAIRFFVETGVVEGDGNRLTPKAAATRAETAQVLYNLLMK